MMSHWVWTLRQFSRRIWVRASLFSAPSSTRPRPIALAERPSLDDQEARISGCFTIGGVRSFDQDPRFGAVVLTEIASRAMSPGINDPGTAIDVIGRAVRLLAIWNEPPEPDREVEYPNVSCRR